MKAFLLLALLNFYMFSAFGKDNCRLYRLKGEVEIRKNDLALVLAADTASEKFLVFDRMIQSKAAPYIDKTVLAKALLLSGAKTKNKIVKIESIELAASDPLNRNQKTAMKDLGEAQCP